MWFAASRRILYHGGLLLGNDAPEHRRPSPRFLRALFFLRDLRHTLSNTLRRTFRLTGERPHQHH
ncbi:hypothetical protein CCR91_08035 [Thiorhodovibrio winogradskyi]|nr:hypothetical protein [Thiorhodovibrio winogradskyi]